MGKDRSMIIISLKKKYALLILKNEFSFYRKNRNMKGDIVNYQKF